MKESSNMTETEIKSLTLHIQRQTEIAEAQAARTRAAFAEEVARLNDRLDRLQELIKQFPG